MRKQLINDHRLTKSHPFLRQQKSANRPTKLDDEFDADIRAQYHLIKKELSSVKNENRQLCTRLQRLENVNRKLEQQINDQQAANSCKLRPTSSHNAVLASSTYDRWRLISVDSARIKIQRLNQTLKDKELLIQKLQSESKHTNLRELRIQQETYLREIVRLRHLQANDMKQDDAINHSLDSNEFENFTRSELTERINSLKNALIKQNEINIQLKRNSSSPKRVSRIRSDVEVKHLRKCSRDDLMHLVVNLQRQLRLEDDKDRKQSKEFKVHDEQFSKQKSDKSHIKDDLKRVEQELLIANNKIKELKQERNIESTSIQNSRQCNSADSEHSRNKRSSIKEESREKEIELYRRNHAAKTIQSYYRHYREQENARDIIASASMAHHNRLKRQRMVDVGNGNMSDTESEAINIIHAAVHAHAIRLRRR